MKYYAAISANGAKLRGGLFKDGKPIAQEASPYAEEDSYITNLTKIVGLVRGLCAKAGVSADGLSGTGVCLPGALLGREVARFGGGTRPFAQDLFERTGVRSVLCDPFTAEAVGEGKFGAGRGFSDLVYLSLGERAGSAVLLDGQPLELGRGNAEHMVIETGGVPCACGRRGCFGGYVSAAALVRETKRAMFENKSSKLWEIISPDNADEKTAFEFAKEGDAAAQKVVKTNIYCLGEGILNLVSLYRPQAIVVGGTIAEEGEFLLQPLRKYLGDRLDGSDIRELTLARGSLSSPDLLGAYALAAERLD